LKTLDKCPKCDVLVVLTKIKTHQYDRVKPGHVKPEEVFAFHCDECWEDWIPTSELDWMIPPFEEERTGKTIEELYGNSGT
jgi:hypothetical protein